MIRDLILAILAMMTALPAFAGLGSPVIAEKGYVDNAYLSAVAMISASAAIQNCGVLDAQGTSSFKCYKQGKQITVMADLSAASATLTVSGNAPDSGSYACAGMWHDSKGGSGEVCVVNFKGNAQVQFANNPGSFGQITWIAQ